MEQKDWILLFIPIIFNGILIFIFQKIIIVALEKMNQRDAIRNDVCKDFWNQLRKINECFIQANIDIQKNAKPVNECLEVIEEHILGIIKYYDCNEFDLRFLWKLVGNLSKNWDNFKKTYNNYCSIELDLKKKEELGQKLQLVKDSIQKIIKKLRKKF